MKKLVLLSVTAALLVLSGCSDKEPVVDAPQEEVVNQHAQEAESVNTESVASDLTSVSSESMSGSSDSNEMNMDAMEKKLLSIYFDFDKFDIRANMKANLSTDVEIAKSATSKFTVKLEGNCDEWGSDEYNFALGLKRANGVKKALVADGVDASSITMVSYGESNPACNEKTRECWAENRRVDFKLLP